MKFLFVMRRWFFSNEDDDLQVWQLPPLAGILLRFCDGKRTVTEITHQFSLLEIELGDVPAEKACLFGLVQLIEDGVIGLSSVPLIQQHSATLATRSPNRLDSFRQD